MHPERMLIVMLVALRSSRQDRQCVGLIADQELIRGDPHQMSASASFRVANGAGRSFHGGFSASSTAFRRELEGFHRSIGCEKERSHSFWRRSRCQALPRGQSSDGRVEADNHGETSEES